MRYLITVFMLLNSVLGFCATNNTSSNLQKSLYTVATELAGVREEVDFIVKNYFATTASTLVGAAASGDAVTVTSKLTKAEFTAGITMSQQLQNFFTNQVVTTADYMASVHNLINGSNPLTTALSQDVEAIGDKLVNLANKSLLLSKSCQSIIAAYNASELASALAAMSSTTIVFGADIPKQLFVDGVTLCQEVFDFYGNASVTQADWMSTISKWNQSI